MVPEVFSIFGRFWSLAIQKNVFGRKMVCLGTSVVARVPNVEKKATSTTASIIQPHETARTALR